MVDIDFVAGGNQAGAGAPVLKGYIDQARAANPNTLVVMAGDSWGATPPHSAFFNDTPAVTAMNMMGVDADTFGNHNFDRGISHLQSQIDLAEFPFVAANLKGLEENLNGVTKRQFFTVDGVRVALIGIVNEEAPTLTAPGSLGTLQISDSVEEANKAARQARSAGAQVVVILTHKGLRNSAPAEGELIDFADAVDPALIDVIVGDHTNISYNAVHQGRIRVREPQQGRPVHEGSADGRSRDGRDEHRGDSAPCPDRRHYAGSGAHGLCRRTDRRDRTDSERRRRSVDRRDPAF